MNNFYKDGNNNHFITDGKKNTYVSVCHPKSFNDIEFVITMLKEGKPVIIYVNKLKEDDAQRVLDLVSGAVFALDGGIHEIKDDIFLLTPESMKIMSEDN